MFAQECKETIGFSRCHVCGAEGLQWDQFCRRCGSNHDFRTAPLEGGANRAGMIDGETRPLPSANGTCGSFSGALMQIVAQGLSARTSSFHDQRWAMGLIGALVALPLWLMIILLSPLDAIVAARAIAKQV